MTAAEGVVGRSVVGERGAEGGDREADSGGRHERWIGGNVWFVGCGGVAWWFYGGRWRPSRYPIASLAKPRRLGLAHYEGEPLPPPTPARRGGWRFSGDLLAYDPCASGDEDEGRVLNQHDLTLQRLAESWHTLRFPDASAPLVLVKAVEELGEVASALIAEIGLTSATGHSGDIPAECADVVVALLVLVGRWYPHRNLLEEVRLKLHTLLTPGPHLASVLP